MKVYEVRTTDDTLVITHVSDSNIDCKVSKNTPHAAAKKWRTLAEALAVLDRVMTQSFQYHTYRVVKCTERAVFDTVVPPCLEAYSWNVPGSY